MKSITPPNFNQHSPIHIVGCGLAGSEAAYFLAQQGFKVIIHEMRPHKMTEAHKTSQCAELVCSNSLKSEAPHSAPGILKSEMTVFNSLILSAAQLSRVPGGEALTVDRDVFSNHISKILNEHPRIEFKCEEVLEPFNDGPTLIATGPLTSDGLSKWLMKSTGDDGLYFYDAIAPIVDAQSIDRNKVFLANRYDKGEEKAYLNCPFTFDEYERFVDALISGEKTAPKNFEKEIFFQGCQPIESIASKGRESLRFGPMKPVGLDDPKTGRRAHAVVQLRPENTSLTAYNMVGFQTKLKWGEQKRIFKMIPGLENVEFLRMGSIHRNTYVCAPRVLRADLSLKGNPHVYLAGQVSGVEGYLESAAIGLLSALFISQRLQGREHLPPPANTALGSLLRHVVSTDPDHYQPNNIQFGLFDPRFFEFSEGVKFGRDEARVEMAKQALASIKVWARKMKVYERGVQRSVSTVSHF
jgi:methylenetetrahydrofolate--tRNA-(uracil-5-)-methyltransferase